MTNYILIADDYKEVVDLLQDHFSDYKTLSAGSVSQAKKIIDDFGDSIKVVISDIDFQSLESGFDIYHYYREKSRNKLFVFYSTQSTKFLWKNFSDDPHLFAVGKMSEISKLSSLVELYTS